MVNLRHQKKSLTALSRFRNVAAMRLSGNQNRVHGHAMNLVCLPAPAVELIRWWMPYPDRQEEPN